jgi:hypothetical protein
VGEGKEDGFFGKRPVCRSVSARGLAQGRPVGDRKSICKVKGRMVDQTDDLSETLENRK